MIGLLLRFVLPIIAGVALDRVTSHPRFARVFGTRVGRIGMQVLSWVVLRRLGKERFARNRVAKG